ncbi:hypothetical protein OAM96_02240 [Candidatus Poseidoniaceae archaeon]|nr:hypothetical protein [Candidatus Poseidoniaceae archaeon]|tara:strand:+ start:7950 stop:8723 length:774 start_codon:yes stop_codon:yes gene_type:complete
MTPDELLKITPDLLARAILHRREQLAEDIPEQLDARQEELDFAVPLASFAKEKRDEFDKQINEITDKCLHSQNQANLKFTKLESDFLVTDTENKEVGFDELLQQYKEANENHHQQTIILEQMNDLAIEQFDKISSANSSDSDIESIKSQHKDILDAIALSKDSHAELLPLKNEKEHFNNTYLENETMRRRANSRTALLSQALDSSERGIEHWQQLIDKGFDRLLVNAKRVSAGEYSTPALSKMNKDKNSQVDRKEGA